MQKQTNHNLRSYSLHIIEHLIVKYSFIEFNEFDKLSQIRDIIDVNINTHTDTDEEYLDISIIEQDIESVISLLSEILPSFVNNDIDSKLLIYVLELFNMSKEYLRLIKKSNNISTKKINNDIIIRMVEDLFYDENIFLKNPFKNASILNKDFIFSVEIKNK